MTNRSGRPLPRVRPSRLLAAALLAAALLSCSPVTRGTAAGAIADEGGPTVRVVVATKERRLAVSGSGGWQLVEEGGYGTLVRGAPGDTWTVEAPQGGLMRAVRGDGVPTAMRPGPFVLRPAGRGALVTIGGKRYRGEVAIVATDSGLVAVNRLPVEDYLRGVVPLEIGARTPGDEAAVQAQAVAARSYTYTRRSDDPRAWWDLRASELDQVYGGAEAETPIGDEAVARTRGLVITYGGRPVSAPYHSTCGGTTAAPDEVWRSDGAPYLQRVSDRIPGTGRSWCDISPRFRWTRTFDRAQLRAALDRWLPAYGRVPAGGVGTPRDVRAEGTTLSGRVQPLAVTTDRGTWRLRGNEIRFVLRSSGGELLPSTYFTVETQRDGAGAVSRLVLRGAGNGHGVGMCQWGAIGRARAGQDFRTILRAYYPGTTVASVD